MTAIRQAFGDHVLSGCNFHFAQAIKRKIDKLSLRKTYDSDLNFIEFIRFIELLQYVPIEDYSTALKFINKAYGLYPFFYTVEERKTISRLMIYLSSTWFQESARYPPSLWNNFGNNLSKVIFSAPTFRFLL